MAGGTVARISAATARVRSRYCPSIDRHIKLILGRDFGSSNERELEGARGVRRTALCRARINTVATVAHTMEENKYHRQAA
jgi:hypothetical protein